MIKDKDFKALYYLRLVGRISFISALSIILSFLFGWWLDKHLGTLCLFAIIFLILGLVGALYYTYYTVVNLDKKDD